MVTIFCEMWPFYVELTSHLALCYIYKANELVKDWVNFLTSLVLLLQTPVLPLSTNTSLATLPSSRKTGTQTDCGIPSTTVFCFKRRCFQREQSGLWKYVLEVCIKYKASPSESYVG